MVHPSGAEAQQDALVTIWRTSDEDRLWLGSFRSLPSPDVRRSQVNYKQLTVWGTI